MGIKKEEKWTCDLCGTTRFKGKETTGWVNIEVDDLMQNRVWHSKIICKSCVDSIANATKEA